MNIHVAETGRKPCLRTMATGALMMASHIVRNDGEICQRGGDVMVKEIMRIVYLTRSCTGATLSGIVDQDEKRAAPAKENGSIN